MDRRRLIEPGAPTEAESRSQRPRTTTLPEDLLREQTMRMQLLYALGIGLWTLNLVMDAYVAPHGDRGPFNLLIEAVGALAAAGGVWFVRSGRLSDRTKVDVSVAMMVPHAFGLALLNSWTEQSATTRPLSPITVLILVFGMLAPARPEKTLVVCLVAASMDPFGVWIAHLRGLAVPSALRTVLLFYPNYVCAVLAVAPARILYRLGRQIREARDLGSYQLVERLGEGGMGEVWLARHRLLARNAAIKLIRPEVLGDAGRDQAMTIDRFEREAQATAALTSPHTIRVFDFGITDEGTFYYAMELLNGCDLESFVRNFGPLPAARAMHLIRQVCQSLAEAHAMGLIHRDIKPANIYVCRMGLELDFAKVLDFGLVKHEDRPAAPTMLTSGRVTVGTPAYMAPEVILGDPNIDCRVDVYAIGCVAYFLLTGEPVFRAETPMKMLMQHVQIDPVPPSFRAEQHIPRAIDDLVMACLQKDPNRRPRDAAELLQMILECRMRDTWDQRDARQWWATHLPDLAAPVTATTAQWKVAQSAFAEMPRAGF